MPLSEASPAREAPSGSWDGDDSTAKAAESWPGEVGWIISPEKPPTSFPCWPKQTAPSTMRSGSSLDTWVQPSLVAAQGSCRLHETPLVSGPLARTREASDFHTHPKKISVNRPNDGKPDGSQPSFPEPGTPRSNGSAQPPLLPGDEEEEGLPLPQRGVTTTPPAPSALLKTAEAPRSLLSTA